MRCEGRWWTVGGNTLKRWWRWCWWWCWWWCWTGLGPALGRVGKSLPQAKGTGTLTIYCSEAQTTPSASHDAGSSGVDTVKGKTTYHNTLDAPGEHALDPGHVKREHTARRDAAITWQSLRYQEKCCIGG